MSEQYTPAYSSNSTQFMERRGASTHAAFFAPHLAAGMHVLDCGCGPGTISIDLAKLIMPGQLTGIDREPGQIAKAQERAAREDANAQFRVSGAYELPFHNETFDAVFSHALLEHLREPERAVAEMRRVLKPGGVLGVRSPDWGGFLVHPYSADMEHALSVYEGMQQENGGDTRIGRRLATLLRSAGLQEVRASAAFEVYEDPILIGDFLAEHLDANSAGGAKVLNEQRQRAAQSWRTWARHKDAFFAQAWLEAVGWR